MTQRATTIQRTQKRIRNFSFREHRFDIINTFFLIILVFICLYPIVFSLSASFSDPVAVTSGDVILFPKRITFESYEAVFGNQDILRGYRNSILIALMGTFVNMVMTVLAAFPLSRKDLAGRNAITFIIMLTMFFSGGMIPNYLLIQDLGMHNTWAALILPGAISTYNMIIMRTYFQTSVPFELQEAAVIDGASNTKILLMIVLPLSAPVLAVISLYYLVGHWNAYFNALLYIRDRTLYPLQLILRDILVLDETTLFQTSDVTSAVTKIRRAETIKYAVVIVSSVPMLILYPFVQRFFVKGVQIGALKG